MANRWNPWNELMSAQGQAGSFFNEAFGHAALPVHPVQMVKALPLDIRRSEDAFRIEASLPGFRPEDVDITCDENVLTIRGVRSHDEDATRGDYVQRERHMSSVHRHVYLPTQVRADEITATFDNGVLTITVPREQKAQPKRIPVKTAAGEEPKLIESSVVAAPATV